MCLAFNVRQDGRSLALDPLDPARRAGNEFERKHDQGRRPLAYRRAGIGKKNMQEAGKNGRYLQLGGLSIIDKPPEELHNTQKEIAKDLRRKGASEPKGGKGEERPANEWEGGSKGASPPWPT